MTTPAPPHDDDIPRGRLFLWTLIALVLIAGVYLYFRYDDRIIPLLG